MDSKTILLIEDDRDISNLIQRNVIQLGLAVDVAADGESALELFRERRYSLVILDIGLPGVSGFEITKRIRQLSTHVPIIIVTAQREEIDRILGLELGADDYLCKPFGIRELLARISAILRRSERLPELQPQGGLSKINYLDMEIDLVTQLVTRNGNLIPLTVSEYGFLIYLAASPGVPKDRDHLLSSVWGYTAEGYDQIISNCVSRLRKKIEDNPEEPQFVQTVRGVGYRFGDPAILKRALRKL